MVAQIWVILRTNFIKIISSITFVLLVFLSCNNGSDKGNVASVFDDELYQRWNELDSADCYLYRHQLLRDKELDYEAFIGGASENIKITFGNPDLANVRNTDTIYYYKVDCKYIDHYSKGYQNNTQPYISGEVLVFIVNYDSIVKDAKYIELD